MCEDSREGEGGRKLAGWVGNFRLLNDTEVVLMRECDDSKGTKRPRRGSKSFIAIFFIDDTPPFPLLLLNSAHFTISKEVPELCISILTTYPNTQDV